MHRHSYMHVRVRQAAPTHMTQLTMRWQWDDDATDTTRYVARTLEANLFRRYALFLYERAVGQRGQIPYMVEEW